MAHLIDKDALVAEKDNILDYADEHWDVEYVTGARMFADKLEDAINTLEVKEVDLEKEIQNVIHNHFFDLNGIAIAGTSSYATVDDMVYIARHFFELGLKVNNEKEK